MNFPPEGTQDVCLSCKGSLGSRGAWGRGYPVGVSPAAPLALRSVGTSLPGTKSFIDATHWTSPPAWMGFLLGAYISKKMNLPWDGISHRGGSALPGSASQLYAPCCLIL